MSSSSNSDTEVKSDNNNSPSLSGDIRIEGRSGLRLHPAFVRVQMVGSTEVDSNQAFFAADLLYVKNTRKEESSRS